MNDEARLEFCVRCRKLVALRRDGGMRGHPDRKGYICGTTHRTHWGRAVRQCLTVKAMQVLWDGTDAGWVAVYRDVCAGLYDAPAVEWFTEQGRARGLCE